MLESRTTGGPTVPGTETAGRLAGRLALGGLALVLVFLAGFSIWSVVRTRDATSQAARAARQSSLFDRARFAVANEEALERGYQVAPAASVRSEFTATAAGLVSLLHQIRATGSPSDRAVAKSVLAEQARYLAIARQMFAQVDAGDAARTLALGEFPSITEHFLHVLEDQKQSG